jgi:hypothetical protein
MKTRIPNLSSSYPITHPQLEALKLPAFDGFPYIWTRVVPALYHLALVPGTCEVKLLQHIAQRQASANRLPTCLVLSENECYYYTPDGRESRESSIPRGGFIVSGKLQLCVKLEQDDNLLARQRRLFIYEAERNGTNPGYLFGDLTKGGRDATVDEQLRLGGRAQNGVPRGLSRCANCGERAGECLDPSHSCAPRRTRSLGDIVIASNSAVAKSLLYRRVLSSSVGTVTSRSKCVWLSISPGSKVAPPKSTVRKPAGACACTCAGEPTSLILPSSISTAAGESTFPVRGSSRRPALTRVTGADEWAAICPIENRPKNSGASNVHSMRIRLSPPFQT